MLSDYLVEDDVAPRTNQPATDSNADPAKAADRDWLIASAKTGRAALRNVDAALANGTLIDITHLTPEEMVKRLIS
jgi:hypothetical protein